MYRDASDEQRQSIVIVFAVRTMAVKGVLYEVGKLNIVEEETTVMLINFILKREGGKSVVITNRRKILYGVNRSPREGRLPVHLLLLRWTFKLSRLPN